MKRFLLLFSAIGILLFLGVYFPFSPFYEINSWQTSLTNSLLRNFLDWAALPARWEENTVTFANGSYLVLTDACNGMAAFLLFVSAAAALPGAISKKLEWFILSYAAITFANLLRLAGVSVAMHFDAQAYVWAHDIVGRYGFGLFILLLYALFIFLDAPKPKRKIPALGKKILLFASIAVSIPLLYAANLPEKRVETETCRYIVTFRPGIDEKRADAVLKTLSMTKLHTYTAISKAAGKIILLAESNECGEEFRKRVMSDTSIESAEPESRRETYKNEKPGEDSEASYISTGTILFLLGGFAILALMGRKSFT